MNIKQFAQKLRHAADVLDELVGIDRNTSNETPAMAAKIQKELKNIRKGKSYKGKHWTQKPENKARLRKILRDALAKKKAMAT